MEGKKREREIEGLVVQPSFITPEEETALLAHIDGSEWNTSLKRRTQHYGYTYDYKEKDAAKPATPIPEWCTSIIDRLSLRPDQLIINEYLPGQGIAPHIDSTASFADGIVSISLGSNIYMDFIHRDTGEKREEMLPRCSMLSLHGCARYEWKHGIASRKSDHGVKRKRRVSLTFRKTHGK